MPENINNTSYQDVYVGVTPGKEYTINRIMDDNSFFINSDTYVDWFSKWYADTTLFNHVSKIDLVFSYSPDINNHTPTVTDYIK